MPYDPITKSDKTWILIYEEPDPLAEPAETDIPEGGGPGIIDVRSGSAALPRARRVALCDLVGPANGATTWWRW